MLFELLEHLKVKMLIHELIRELIYELKVKMLFHILKLIYTQIN